MAGCNVLNSTVFGECDKPSQFHAFVATDTGIRRRAACVAAQKIIDDRLPKQLALIDDLIGDLQALRHIPGNADLAAAAFLPLL